MRFLVASTLVANAVVATPALAQQETGDPFKGLGATVIVGVDHAATARASGTGVVYGGQIAYDVRTAKTVFGIEGEITGAGTRSCYTRAVVANDRFCDRADRDLYIGGRVGRVVGGATLLYVKGGYTNVRDAFDYRDAGTGTNNYKGSGTRGGIRGGIGAETRIGDAFSIKAEYRYSNYANSDLSRNQGVIGVGFHF